MPDDVSVKIPQGRDAWETLGAPYPYGFVQSDLFKKLVHVAMIDGNRSPLYVTKAELGAMLWNGIGEVPAGALHALRERGVLTLIPGVPDRIYLMTPVLRTDVERGE